MKLSILPTFLQLIGGIGMLKALFLTGTFLSLPQCTPIVGTIATLDLVSQTITLQGNPEIGVIVPIHGGTLPDLDEVLNPFPSIPP